MNTGRLTLPQLLPKGCQTLEREGCQKDSSALRRRNQETQEPRELKVQGRVAEGTTRPSYSNKCGPCTCVRKWPRPCSECITVIHTWAWNSACSNQPERKNPHYTGHRAEHSGEFYLRNGGGGGRINPDSVWLWNHPAKHKSKT